MRVPIFSQDILPGKGVLRLAKLLRRDWPCANPIRLCAAQNLISKCLGYTDYYDVRNSVNRADSVFPSESELIEQTLETIRSEILKVNKIQQADLDGLREKISIWPFKSLKFFQTSSTAPSVIPTEKMGHDTKLMAMYYSDPKNWPGVAEDNFTSILEQVSVATGHHGIASTLKYVITPIGACINVGRRSSLALPLPECMNCGPAILKK